MVFGRKGCHENRDYTVRIYFISEGDDYIEVVEQLAEKEARPIFDKLNEELSDDKKKTLMVEIDDEKWCILKVNVTGIRMFRN
ncbi:hypothetical protein LCGC14_3111690 [marine sediment metagenome]|uniref:Uncharacterized protein n=1 Tax=marine sediment metagenome TaxID=412755 RepID=A0A0F8YC88_9ZZZZ